MAWPTPTDYNEAVQRPRVCLEDEELRGGEVVRGPLGMPLLWSGNFADVYQIHCPATGNTWALKCFTRQVQGLQQRYRAISAHLEQAKLPFTVDFRYLERGISIGGHWYPVLKMHWVEGLTLNQFVEEHLQRPQNLKKLLGLWVKLATWLREAGIAHADLQHGNVLLVRKGGSLALRLIDYDGMYVPGLANTRSGELGLPAYQHPQRIRESVYSAEVDRFSHLVIYTAIHCLMLGRDDLWQRFNMGENLLFRDSDFRCPEKSDLFRSLWQMGNAEAEALVGRLILACRQPLEETPLLDDIVAPDGKVLPLSASEMGQVEAILSPAPLSSLSRMLEAETAARKKVEEEISQRTADVEAALKAAQAEAAARKKVEEELTQRNTDVEAAQKAAQAEAMARKKVEEELAQRKAEEEAAQKVAQAEAIARKKAEEELAQKNADMEAAQKAVHAAARARKSAEEELAQRNAEVEVALKAAQDELAARKKLEDEIAQRKAELEATQKAAQAEAAARKKAEAETAAQKKAEEKAARRKAKTEAAAQKNAEADAAVQKKAEEKAARKEAQAEAEARRKVEVEAARLKSQAAAEAKARKKAEDEAARLKARAEAAARRKAEEEAAPGNSSERVAPAAETAPELPCFPPEKPALARPLGWPWRLWRWCKREPVLAAMAAAVVLVLALGNIVSALLAVAARDGENSARRQLAEVKTSHRDLSPSPGEGRDLPIRLEPLPAVYSVEIEPAGAVLQVSDSKAASLMQDGRKWTITVNRPDGKTAIALVASMAGYDPLRQELVAVPGESRSLPSIRLTPKPAETFVLNLDLPRGSRVRVKDLTYVDQREITLHGLVPNQFQSIPVRIDFPSGKSDERELLCKGGQTARLALLDPNTAMPELVVQTRHAGHLHADAFSQDGRQLLTGSCDGSAILWDLATGRKLRTFRHRDGVEFVAFSSDGQLVLTGAGTWACDRTTILWDATTGQKLRTFEGLPCALSADGQRVLTNGQGNTKILWDATTGQKLRTFEGQAYA